MHIALEINSKNQKEVENDLLFCLVPLTFESCNQL
jgi:hypothetical protein